MWVVFSIYDRNKCWYYPLLGLSFLFMIHVGLHAQKSGKDVLFRILYSHEGFVFYTSSVRTKLRPSKRACSLPVESASFPLKLTARIILQDSKVYIYEFGY